MSTIAANGSNNIKRSNKNFLDRVLEVTGMARHLRQARTERELLSMSDRQLRDIGLNRYEISAYVRSIN